VVGGALRDALLGRPFQDVDWLVADPERAARELAGRLGGRPFALDAARGHWRLVADGRVVDLIRLDGPLEADLARRDFTIDAMALTPAGPVDPLGGRADLAARRLVRAGPTSLRDDVLRGLRGVRLAATLELRWDEATRQDATRVVREALDGRRPLPAAERMRDELTLLLSAPRPGDALADAHALGWLEALLPELVAGDGVAQGGFHHLDVLQHQFEALQRLATGFRDADLALRLATLLHDVGKPACRERGEDGRLRFHGHAQRGAEMTLAALRRLRYPEAVARRAAELVRRHMLPLPRDEREARRFVHRRRELLPDLLQLMVADREAARGRLSSDATRRAYRTALARVLAILAEPSEPAPLLDGRAVMRELGLAPGPEVGRALAFLAEAEAVGDVRDEAEARAALRRFAVAQGWTPADVDES
jgi:poly(A) polymerase